MSAKHESLPDLLLRKGSMTGPYRQACPIRWTLIRRMVAALCDLIRNNPQRTETQ